jgi:cellulose biosynthesis protein BcsQ
MKAIDLINEIRENGNPDLRFLRLLINQVDRRTYTSKVTISNIRKFFSEDKVFETMIPTNAAFEHAEAEELTIIRYNPTTLGARAYRRLAAELLDIFEKDTTN